MPKSTEKDRYSYVAEIWSTFLHTSPSLTTAGAVWCSHFLVCPRWQGGEVPEVVPVGAYRIESPA